MAKKESKIFNEILVAASKLGVRLFRNNVGAAWQGKTVGIGMGDAGVKLLNPRRVKYGLCTGSSDAIGWTPVEIKPEHVGKTMAIFTAIETKGTPRKATKEQINFIERVIADGGIAVVAYSVEDADEAIREAIG